MNTYQVAQLCRQVCDEPDLTFLTSDILADMLQRAYDQFRGIVMSMMPLAYTTSRDITIPAAGAGLDYQEYDLTQAGANPTVVGSPSLAGAQPNAVGTTIPRMEKLLAVETIPALAGGVRYRLRPATSIEGYAYGGATYRWQGQSLIINGINTGFVRLTYVPEQSIGLSAVSFYPTWRSVITSGTAVYIDDWNEWHDLIALLAYDEYAMRDGAENPAVLRRRDRRLAEFKDAIQKREYAGSRYVQRVQDESGWSY